MTRKEKEKILLDRLGLKIGDTVKIKYYSKYRTVEIVEDAYNYSLMNEDGKINIGILLKNNFEIVKQPKKYKDMRCCIELSCARCPLKHIADHCPDKITTPQQRLDTLYLDNEEREFYQKRIDEELI